jgi:hypothetical protein
VFCEELPDAEIVGHKPKVLFVIVSGQHRAVLMAYLCLSSQIVAVF